MRSHLPRIEDGLNRLFYVLWVLWFVGCSHDAFTSPSFDWYREDVRNALIQSVGVGLVIPALFRLAVRWVYRGFVPKPQ